MADLAEARAVARAKAGAICQSKFAQRARYTRAKRRAAGRMFRRHDLFPGGYRGRVPPVPIPNTEVKPATADGTARATVWESRSLPGLFLQGRVPQARGLFFFERVCFFQWRGAPPPRYLSRFGARLRSPFAVFTATPTHPRAHGQTPQPPCKFSSSPPDRRIFGRTPRSLG